MTETSKSPPYSLFDVVDKCDTYPYPGSTYDSSSEPSNNNIPFLLDNDIKVGLLLPSTVKVLIEYNNHFKKPKPFIIDNKFVKFASHLNTFELRTEVVKQLFDKWREEKTFPALSGWRDELYPIYGDPNNPSGVAFVMERCATPLFGVLTFGVHLNGFIRTEQGELKMWIAKRAKTKPTWPGWLDNTVAGGIPYTLSVTESAIKESMEEASLPAEVAEKALPTGAISYFIETQNGLQPEVQYVYDLELPLDVEPKPLDGEVECFYLWDVDERVNSNPIALVIDFLIRHSIVNPDNEPNYMGILSRIHRRLNLPGPSLMII
ncbi:4865_t:CDS:2 [Funneliformis caledonium]|uniref:4865_t:CDS:1 n=1 Tax=Funneliformis caledonium TaxID=1117310 RepID=A0A9N9GRF7_9GLOM|nr:4865_t:CDS:2 [Funneliformis caledonium]